MHVVLLANDRYLTFLGARSVGSTKIWHKGPQESRYREDPHLTPLLLDDELSEEYPHHGRLFESNSFVDTLKQFVLETLLTLNRE